MGVSLTEGKNREVRKVLEALGLKVNRLIRVAYGPLDLGDLRPGEVEEVPARQLRQLIQTGFAGEPPYTPSRNDGRTRPGASTAKSPQKPGGKPQRGSSASGGGPRAPGEPGKDTPITYKPGWARPKHKPKPTPKPGGAKPSRSKPPSSKPAGARPSGAAPAGAKPSGARPGSKRR